MVSYFECIKHVGDDSDYNILINSAIFMQCPSLPAAVTSNANFSVPVGATPLRSLGKTDALAYACRHYYQFESAGSLAGTGIAVASVALVAALLPSFA